MNRKIDRLALRGVLMRALVLGLDIAALIASVRAGWVAALGLLALALALYVFGRSPRPAGLRPAAGPAIYGPDWLGFALVSFFICLPVWASPEWPMQSGLHPSAFLAWPMAALCLSLIAVGWQADSFALTMNTTALQIRRRGFVYHIELNTITGIRPWRRDLPGWMRRMTRLLLIAGHPGPAGAIMLARPRHGIDLSIAGHGRFSIETDGLNGAIKPILRQLSAARTEAR